MNLTLGSVVPLAMFKGVSNTLMAFVLKSFTLCGIKLSIHGIH